MIKYYSYKLGIILSVIIVMGFAGFASSQTNNAAVSSPSSPAASDTANGAVLSIVTAQDNYQVSDQFNADIKINSQGVGINAAQATIKFSPAVLEVVSIDKTSSVFNFWIQDPAFDNNAGQITFIGGSSSGLIGKSLQVIRVVFKAKGLGQSDLTFTDGAVTASDGSGTNVLSSMVKGSITVGNSTTTTPQVQIIERTPITSDTAPAKPIVKIPLYPDPSSWYNNSSKFTATWQLPNDISSIATDLDKYPTFDPSKSGGIFDNQTFSALSDGVWYLNVRFYNNMGWSPTNHYRIAIDTVPPAPFDINFSDGLSSDNPTPTISFQTKDQLSGIDHYYVQVDSGTPVNVNTNTYVLPAQKPGKHTLKVGAQDKAGNQTESTAQFEILPIAPPKIFSASTNVFVGEGGLFVNGSSVPNSSVILDVTDSGGNSIYNFTTSSDQNGIWSMKIDSPLKKGTYYILATAQDSRGALSLPVKSDAINAEERPIVTILGFGITYTDLIIILLIILIGGYGVGWYTGKLVSKQRQRRIIISQRDVSASFNVIKRDVQEALKSWNDGKIESHELTQIEFLLKNINANIDKLQKYIISGIKDIGGK